jgi:membrane protein required for colicin V production
MVETQLNLFDAAVIGIMVLSCLLAFFRGFVREILSLGAWIGAGIVTIYFFPSAAKYLEPYFKKEVVAAGFATLGLYVTSLIGFSLINRLILQFMKSGNDVGLLDNALGLFFGAARGAFIVSLGFFLLTMAIPKDQYPDWLTESITRPYAERGAIALAKIAPEYLREISSLQKKATDEIQEDKSAEKEGGYSEKMNKQMKRLQETIEQE